MTGIPSGIVPGFQNFTGKIPADYLRLNMAIPPAKTPDPLGRPRNRPGRVPERPEAGRRHRRDRVAGDRGPSPTRSSTRRIPPTAAAGCDHSGDRSRLEHGDRLPCFPRRSTVRRLHLTRPSVVTRHASTTFPDHRRRRPARLHRRAHGQAEREIHDLTTVQPEKHRSSRRPAPRRGRRRSPPRPPSAPRSSRARSRRRPAARSPTSPSSP